ncbi:hypothetical protein [Hydrotalea sp.]|uniref:hypothetical protein n=1 Tax=Hydrotalea sp. TaxID=2881279 RepID=UPI00258ACB77|nr:hypothetical protein [Hydrotalea sp.]
MHYFSLIILFMSCQWAHAQYYYNDIIAAKQSIQNYIHIKNQKIKSIDVQSFDENNEPAKGFALQQLFTNNWTKMILSTQNATGEKSTLITYYKNNLVNNTIERTNHIETTTNYTHDAKNNITEILSVTKDSTYHYQNTEKHIWHYLSGGAPADMIKIKNNLDTTFVHFTYDEHGNVAEEKWIRMGRLIETYYYYYNDMHLLTDIVRFNRNARKLLPDYLFEYNSMRQLSSMTQISPNNNSYLVWNYSYNSAGLKEEDICRNKENQLVARFKYVYHQ